MMIANVVPLSLAIVATILFPDIVAARTCYDAFDILQVQDVGPSFHRFWPKITSVSERVSRVLCLTVKAHFCFCGFVEG